MKRLAVLSYHSSPLVEPGAGDAGGMTVYIRGLSSAVARHGVTTDVFTRATGDAPRIVDLAPGVRVVSIDAGPRRELPKDELEAHADEFTQGVRAFSMTQRLRYEIVHSHYWQSGLAARPLSEAWGAPLVHSQHTLGRVKNRFLPPGDPPEATARLEGEDEIIAAAHVLIASTDDEFEQLACLYGASHDRLKT
ncbi:MAG: glycosyltransferase, partial [Actinomycetota bacterium]